MVRPARNRPTDAELEILGVVWEHAPCTVREVHQRIAERRDAGYTTVLKLMQIMTDKDLLVRDENVRPQIYRPTKSQTHTQRQLVTDLLERAFKGSSGKLVLAALSSRKTSPEERRLIQELLDKHERGTR
jgi:predicted transcriptional regulator